MDWVRKYAVFKAGQSERIIQSLKARKSWNVLIHLYLSTLAGVHVILAVQYNSTPFSTEYSYCTSETIKTYIIPVHA